MRMARHTGGVFSLPTTAWAQDFSAPALAVLPVGPPPVQPADVAVHLEGAASPAVDAHEVPTGSMPLPGAGRVTHPSPWLLLCRRKLSVKADAAQAASREYRVDEHRLTLAQLAARLETHVDVAAPARSRGLSRPEAARRLAAYGPNRLTPPPELPEVLKFARQFTNLLIVMLIVAAALAFLGWGLNTDDSSNVILAGTLCVVIVITCCINYWHERATSNVLASIKDMLPTTCTVVRDGHEFTLPAEQVRAARRASLAAAVPFKRWGEAAAQQLMRAYNNRFIPCHLPPFEHPASAAGHRRPGALEAGQPHPGRLAAHRVDGPQDRDELVDRCVREVGSCSSSRPIHLVDPRARATATALLCSSVRAHPVTAALSSRARAKAGESDAVTCSPDKRSDMVTEARNIVFNSSLVMSGDGRGVVVRTGDDTYIGAIAGLAGACIADAAGWRCAHAPDSLLGCAPPATRTRVHVGVSPPLPHLAPPIHARRTQAPPAASSPRWSARSSTSRCTVSSATDRAGRPATLPVARAPCRSHSAPPRSALVCVQSRSSRACPLSFCLSSRSLADTGSRTPSSTVLCSCSSGMCPRACPRPS